MMIPKTNTVRYRGRRKKAEQLVERLPEDAWTLVTPAAESCYGRHPWEWACLELCADRQKGMGRWLLFRRAPEDPEDLTFYQACAPQRTSVAELISVCQRRWKIEDCFAEAKGEVGLDQYEVRRWEAWHRYVTLCLLAHAFLVIRCLLDSREEEAATKASKKGIPSRI